MLWCGNNACWSATNFRPHSCCMVSNKSPLQATRRRRYRMHAVCSATDQQHPISQSLASSTTCKPLLKFEQTRIQTGLELPPCSSTGVSHEDSGRTKSSVRLFIGSIVTALTVQISAADVCGAQVAATLGPSTDNGDLVVFPREQIERLLTEEFAQRVHQLSNKELAALFERLLSSDGRNIPNLLLDFSPSSSAPSESVSLSKPRLPPEANNSSSELSGSGSNSVALTPGQSLTKSQSSPNLPTVTELSSSPQTLPSSVSSSSSTQPGAQTQSEEADSDATSQLLNGFLTQQLDSTSRPLDTTSSFLSSFLSGGKGAKDAPGDESALTGISPGSTQVDGAMAMSETAGPTLQERAAELALKAGSAAFDAAKVVGKAAGEAAWDAVTHAIEAAQESAQNAGQDGQTVGQNGQTFGQDMGKSSTQFMGQLPGQSKVDQGGPSSDSWLPALPALPSLPSVPSLPQVQLPQLPSVSLPDMPNSLPALPSLPSFSAPQLPSLPQLPSFTSPLTASDTKESSSSSTPSALPLTTSASPQSSPSQPSASPSSAGSKDASSLSQPSSLSTPSTSQSQQSPAPSTDPSSQSSSTSSVVPASSSESSSSVPPVLPGSITEAPSIGPYKSTSTSQASQGLLPSAAQVLALPGKVIGGIQGAVKGFQSTVDDVQDFISSAQDIVSDPDAQEQVGKFATGAGFFAAIAGGYILIDAVAPAEPTEQQQQTGPDNAGTTGTTAGDGKPVSSNPPVQADVSKASTAVSESAAASAGASTSAGDVGNPATQGAAASTSTAPGIPQQQLQNATSTVPPITTAPPTSPTASPTAGVNGRLQMDGVPGVTARTASSQLPSAGQIPAVQAPVVPPAAVQPPTTPPARNGSRPAETPVPATSSSNTATNTSSTSSALRMLPAFLFSPLQLLFTPMIQAASTSSPSLDAASKSSSSAAAGPRPNGVTPSTAPPFTPATGTLPNGATPPVDQATVVMRTTIVRSIDGTAGGKQRPMLLDNVQADALPSATSQQPRIPLEVRPVAPVAPIQVLSNTNNNNNGGPLMAGAGVVLWDRDGTSASTLPGSGNVSNGLVTDVEAYQSMLSALSSRMTPEELAAFMAATSGQSVAGQGTAPPGAILWQRGDDEVAVPPGMEGGKNVVLWERGDDSAVPAVSTGPGVTLWEREEDVLPVEAGAAADGPGVILWQRDDEPAASIAGERSPVSPAQYGSSTPGAVAAESLDIDTGGSDSTVLTSQADAGATSGTTVPFPLRYRSRRARSRQAVASGKGALSRVLDNVDEDRVPQGVNVEYGRQPVPSTAGVQGGVAPALSASSTRNGNRFSTDGVSQNGMSESMMGTGSLRQDAAQSRTEQLTSERNQQVGMDPWRSKRDVDSQTGGVSKGAVVQQSQVTKSLGQGVLDYIYPARHWLDTNIPVDSSPWEAK